MNNLKSYEYKREEELQSMIDSEFMTYISDMIRYILNPDGKIPPKLKENNLGFIFASNLLNLAAKADFESGIIKVDKREVISTYNHVQSILNQHYKPDDNLCYYPLYMMKTSNSSKFVHGLPYVEILEKWYNEFQQNPNRLKDFIENLRGKLHIDDDIEIVTAKVVGRSIHIRMRNDKFDVTIPMGYSTKHEVFTNSQGEAIELNDCYGNIFSPQGVDEINYYLSDEEIKQNIENVQEKGAKYMINFFAWRAPEYVTEDNYKYYYYKELDEDILDEEAILNYEGVLHHFSNGKRVIVKQVNEKDGNFLSSTQDQILPNYGNKSGDEKEQENYVYWKKTYEKELRRLVNLGVDSFRIDLAHGFRKNNDCDLLYTLISDTIKYANDVLNKKIFFILETYDFSNFGGTMPATFRDWNIGFDYPAVKVYHKETEDKFTNIKGDKGLDHFIDDLRWLFQDIRGIHGEMMTASTFDDFTLFDIAEKSGIDFKHILEMEMLLGKAGYNILSLDRDFLGEHGEIIPTVPGGAESHYGSGKFFTHCLSSKDEFQIHIEKDSKSIYESSESLNTLKIIDTYPLIIGLTIDRNTKKMIFTFADNSKRIFDFNILISGGTPYNEKPTIKPNYISKYIIEKLIKLEKLETNIKNNPNLPIQENTSSKRDIPNVYNYDFWMEFTNYVKFESWLKKGIEEWDTYKQEAFFILNRDELIRSFLNYKNIDIDRLDNVELSKKAIEIRKKLQARVNKILKKSIKKKYPDLINK